MANMNITGILEKMTGKDKDYRYMATSDLLSELNKESFKTDQDLEPKLTNIIIQQLEDASGDVSGLAVKCLAPLVKKVSEDRVVEMTNKLCDKLLNGKDQHRDTASIGLKTIIVEVTTPSLAEKILVSLAPQLINGVTSEKSAEIKCECLDILSDVLNRFGNVIAKDHAYMLTALLTQLSCTQASVRKKSVSCIGDKPSNSAVINFAFVYAGESHVVRSGIEGAEKLMDAPRSFIKRDSYYGQASTSGPITMLGNATAHCIPWPRQNLEQSETESLQSTVEQLKEKARTRTKGKDKD